MCDFEPKHEKKHAILQHSRKPLWRVHLEVRLRSTWTLMPPHTQPTHPPLRLPPSAPPSHFYDRECQFGCQGNRLFFPCDVETRGEGRVALFHPTMKDSPYACLIGRLMVGDPTPEPIHHSLIMFNGASDTSILPVLSRGAAPTAGTFAIVADECS